MSDGKRPDDGLGGLFNGINELVEQIGQQIGELAKKSQELHKGGELDNLGEVIRGVYGVTVRNLGGDPFNITVEPFGNVKKDARTGKPTVQEVIEPPVDVFEEPDHFLVLAELPGIGPEDVKLTLSGDTLEIAAERGPKKYRKSVRLPSVPRAAEMSHTCRNGVLEVTLPR
jgi:HSP20 family protein